MTLTINTNLSALNAQRQLGQSANTLSLAMQRLSSGLRINSAADDAAGLAIASRMSTQITGVGQAARNANDGISLAQTADGALASISDNLQRVRQLAVQSANGTNSASDRAALQQEAAQLIAENDRIASQTQFNGINLLDGSFASQQFQVGANRQQAVAMGSIANMNSAALGTYNGFSHANISAPTIGAPSNLIITVTGQTTQVYDLGLVATNGAAIGAAINSAGINGLQSTPWGYGMAVGQTNNGAVNGTGTLTINGTQISVDYVAGSSSAARLARVQTVAAAINAQTAALQVNASIAANGQINIGVFDDRNLSVSWSAGTATGSTASDFGISAGTFSNPPDVSYHAPPGSAVTSITIAGAGISSGTTQVTQHGAALSALDLSTTAGATTAMDSLDAALATVNATRSTLGAMQNRFQSTMDNLQTTGQSLGAARSRITDADFAQETANLSRAQILQNAGTAMVAQANQQPQGVLALLR